MILAFYKGLKSENPKARLFDRAVCWWTHGRFSHVELVAIQAGAEAVCWSSSARDHGVRLKVIDLTNGSWVLVHLPGLDVRNCVQWFQSHEGWGFDYPGIFGYVIPWVKQCLNLLYCSESVASSMGLRGADISPNALFVWASSQPGADVFELAPIV